MRMVPEPQLLPCDDVPPGSQPFHTKKSIYYTPITCRETLDVWKQTYTIMVKSGPCDSESGPDVVHETQYVVTVYNSLLMIVFYI